MNQSATFSSLSSNSTARADAAVHPASIPDSGPWLLFIMPVSYALTLAVVSWLSMTSF